MITQNDQNSPPPRAAALPQELPSLRQLVKLSADDLRRLGLVGINLVCAEDLPGAEELDVDACFARVGEWAELVRQKLPRFASAFREHPEEFRHSEAFFKMTIVVQVLKQTVGLHYKAERQVPASGSDDDAYRDSRDLLLHGPLGPTLSGTCNNIPMAVVAVARELGYPVYLATTPMHVYAKWVEPDGFTFNIEASNPAGMVSHPDEYYRDRPPAMTEAVLRTGSYLRPLGPVEELALCLMSRGLVLEANQRFAESAWAFAQACRLVPNEPMYPRLAALCVEKWVLHSRQNDARPVSSEERTEPVEASSALPLPAEHLPLALAIRGCYCQALGQEAAASGFYKLASAWRERNRRTGRASPTGS